MRAKANRAADAAGISLGHHIELLIARDEVDSAGCPTWLRARDDSQEELPLRNA